MKFIVVSILFAAVIAVRGADQINGGSGLFDSLFAPLEGILGGFLNTGENVVNDVVQGASNFVGGFTKSLGNVFQGRGGASTQKQAQNQPQVQNQPQAQQQVQNWRALLVPFNEYTRMNKTFSFNLATLACVFGHCWLTWYGVN